MIPRLVLLSLAYQKGQDVALLSELQLSSAGSWVPRPLLLNPLLPLRHLVLLPRLMLLSPLLHLRHLVLLSLGRRQLVVLQSTPQARRLILRLAVGMSLWCNS